MQTLLFHPFVIWPFRLDAFLRGIDPHLNLKRFENITHRHDGIQYIYGSTSGKRYKVAYRTCVRCKTATVSINDKEFGCCLKLNCKIGNLVLNNL